LAIRGAISRSKIAALASGDHRAKSRFAVDPESLPSEVEVSHINLNDGTVEGMRHKELPIFSGNIILKLRPGRMTPPTFFDQFAELIEKQK